ncbi:efflux RND transporter permease subunit [Solimicrobium silvestre]|uniref:Cation/multidrug efflux pump n=1 Tax=Solimicrobium silvestre TaxID=2099400 RepID=A0A2S9GZU0_9BURK|nr:efflux RND transporter permease subunit [Solimicrobium silvestre]PRC93252.1 Cation/multidrug efflux pump [Solimicrobium silvestre]
MLWIVRVALRRPLTFIVLALLIFILGPLVYLSMRTDIFPDIKIPVVSVVWTYNGLPPNDISDRIITYYERQMTTTVNDIEHIESQSLSGVGIVKVFFQPDVNINAAVSQVTALSQTVLKRLPPGITPPLILSYNASSVPILQLALSSNTLLDNQLFDISNNFIRPQLAEVEGAAVPSPYGGKNRQIQVDLNLEALRSKGLAPEDVTSAIDKQNLILPAGTEKIGVFEYNILLNASPKVLDELNDLPIKSANKSTNKSTIFLRDVAHVRDGFSPQYNMVRVDGRHSVLTTIQKNGTASTLSIIDHVKKLLPKIEAGAPLGLIVGLVGDQSVFVRSAVSEVIREGVIAATLTGLMILLFLGSWRSTIIITISIPLAILSAIIGLSIVGQTINIMTLGGLALAVGILVDDATVTIENINWHLEQGKYVNEAIMDGAGQIVVPAFVSLLSICIVFIPMFFMRGVAQYLFVPLAEAVIFAMIASFILSRTLVPTMANYLLRPQGRPEHGVSVPTRNLLILFQRAFEKLFIKLRQGYKELLMVALSFRLIFILGFLGFVFVSFLLLPWLGQNFFPTVDAGQIKLHIRAQTGTRLEETTRLCDLIEQEIKNQIPSSEITNIVDNIGLPISGINLSYSNSSPIGPGDADILISLNKGHRPTADYVRQLREKLSDDFPGVAFAFLPADIVSQILNFGLPAPIDIQIIGFHRSANQEYATKLMNRVKMIPGLVDLRIQQAFNQPEFHVNVDRARALDVGLTQRDVATSLLVSLSGSLQTAPNFWVDPKNNVSYPLVVQVPQYQMDTLNHLQNIPITTNAGLQILGGLATITRGQGAAVVSHYDVQPTLDIFGSPQDRDLGAVANDIKRILAETATEVPKGSEVVLRGQVQAMDSAYSGLLFGLVGAIVLIYMLIVVNFQSWLDPFVIITALPAALAGIVWMLFITHTSLSVPALIGSIMCMGVATANSILVVSFAREQHNNGVSGMVAALESGFLRFRPVLMTALAMIIGMTPMALGLGEGGEQNAPLGRAVIGGLIFATFATLFFVPVVFSLVHSSEIIPVEPATESS